jgi:hypothetical protein
MSTADSMITDLGPTASRAVVDTLAPAGKLIVSEMLT